MSYGFYVYTDRESIASTKVYSQTSGKTYEYDCGTGQHSLSGFSDGEYLTFTAVPADGYEFKQWIYHIGSPDAPTQYSTSNPFKYYGSTDNDIYIAAEGESSGGGGGDSGGDETDGEWTLKNYASQRDSFSIWTQFRAGECYCIPVTFTYSGRAIFYCDSYNNGEAADMLAFLSRSNDFDTTSGEPTSYLIYNDDSSDDYNDTIGSHDFGFEYDVTAGVTYYLFVRENLVSYYPGYIDIYCVAPKEDASYFEWSSAVAKGLPVKNVSHTEWDNFIDKIKAVLTDKKIINQPLTEEEYGYDVGTTYNTMLNDCYMQQYDIDLQGYPLTAQMFNVARFIIGSFVSTGIDDKISETSKVLASDLIKLADCLKTWQG